MICIDSDCIIDFTRGKREAENIIGKYKNESVTTEINVFEVFLGLYNKKILNQEEENGIKMFFNSIEIIDRNGWGIKASDIFLNLMRNGKIIDQNDCLIAGIMLANGCNKIITRNADHFSRIKDIEVIPY